jgi:hypothetical protein
VNKYVNLFYHVCVLFSEYFPDEYSLGLLNNSAYMERYAHLKTDGLCQKFQDLWRYSYYAWDFIGKSLYNADTIASIREILKRVSQKQMDIWMDIFLEALPPYESIWRHVKGKLQEYCKKFEAEWKPIHKPILTKMSNITKVSWETDDIKVHFVDCVHGASSWIEDVVLPPFPDMDVEKKLFSHELVHILVPDYFLKTKLRSYGLSYNIAHTIVDLIAYFGVKDHVTEPERRGIKPNPSYYAEVNKLYPIFESCYKNPDQHQNFDEVLKQIKRETAC